ncbi:MAG: mechanosensitive ion channel protein [Saprospiraceae bacterium]|nr:MAG: mechanosensitive ion channel protein [Saprospiraceae bacterium]
MWSQLQEAWTKLSEKLFGWLDAVVLNLPNLIIAILVMTIAYFLSKYVKKYTKKIISKTTRDNTLISVAANVVTASFLILMLFVVLGILNLDKALTSLLAGAGVIGLAVGLALQDPIVNLFSGVMISIREYYKEGDLIETNGYFGKITKVTLRSTILQQPSGQVVIIPNKDVLQNPLVNYSHSGRRRIDLECGVSYGDDLEMVKALVRKTIQNQVDHNEQLPLEIFFKEFGSSSINFVLRFWRNISSQAEYLAATDDAIIAIKKAFDEHNITIPFPIRTLDFGIVGGERLDELYPLKKVTSTKSNSLDKGPAKEN